MGKEFTCKNPKAAPTRKQTWAIFCMTGKDVRDSGLTRQEVSDAIGELKQYGETLFNGERLVVKNGKKKSSEKKSSKTSYRFSWAEDLWQQAKDAGQKAMDELIASNTVQPMIVQQHENQLDDSSPVKESWVVPGGPCGWATINVSCKGKGMKFINQLKKKGYAGDINSFKEWVKSDYYKGYNYSLTLVGGQSLAYKEAYGNAFTEVLRKEGITCRLISRMD